jgi:hypothetical protein
VPHHTANLRPDGRRVGHVPGRDLVGRDVIGRAAGRDAVGRDAAGPHPCRRPGPCVCGGSIRPGEVLLLTRAASPQFVRPITVRVIRHRADLTTYDGWTWIECYQLDARGDAVERRELFVMPAGLIRGGDHPVESRAWSGHPAGVTRR